MIPKRCPNLRFLGLGGCNISNDVLLEIINIPSSTSTLPNGYPWLELSKGCPGLEELQLGGNSNITDTEVLSLSRLELHSLNLSFAENISMQAVAQTVLKLPKLVKLSIAGVWQGATKAVFLPLPLPLSLSISRSPSPSFSTSLAPPLSTSCSPFSCTQKLI